MTGVSVVGLGNVLMGDDAVGPQVVRTLQAFHQFDPAVSLIDADFRSTDLSALVTGTRALIAVNAIRAEGQPGQIHQYRSDEYLRPGPTASRATEGLSLKETLLLMQFRGIVPAELLVIGVVPGEIKVRLGMTREVQAAVPRVVEIVLEELRRLGYPPTRSWMFSDAVPA